MNSLSPEVRTAVADGRGGPPTAAYERTHPPQQRWRRFRCSLTGIAQVTLPASRVYTIRN